MIGRAIDTMGVWDSVKALFVPAGPGPADAPRLDGGNESALSQSLQRLHPAERGWITFGEARSLFSSADAQYAFGETDEAGKRRIESFAGERDHGSQVEFMPLEERVYFVRKAPPAT
jgi:hypothetical protein